MHINKLCILLSIIITVVVRKHIILYYIYILSMRVCTIYTCMHMA